MGVFTRACVLAVLTAGLILPDVAAARERLSSSGRGDRIVIRVDISDQQMVVTRGGHRLYTWPVSTAKPGYVTPTGSFQPEWFSRNHRSSIYNNAPMPFAIFYDGNYAIHATTAQSKLGRPASHGCVRLSMKNARTLYEMVWERGKQGTYVVVQQ
ncbi:MAG: hypothetical protein CR993_03460 [Rhodobacterales bacterium]|nr:MAG: hypothetical protein CR993_03460 [Rhodobacterales bacterium]